MRSSKARIPHFLFADKEERGRTEDAKNDHDFVVAKKVGINHQRDAEEHRLPKIHSLSVNESDEPNRAEDKTAD